MTAQAPNRCCGITLRRLCFIIGYLHMVSSVLDIAFHFFTLGYVTGGFQCDFSSVKFLSIPWLWIEPFLLLINLGTHGFYPFPGIFKHEYSMYIEYTSPAAMPRCYSGMVHLHLIDILNLTINLIWLKIVISYIGALHKKNPEPMRLFFSLSVVKVLMQIIYYGYQPRLYDIYEPVVYCILELFDIIIAISLLIIIRKYSKQLLAEKATQTCQYPASYIECLINASLRGVSGIYEGPEKYGRKVEVNNIDEKKPLPEDEEKKPENPV